MWLICLPMVLLVGALIATGRLGLGGLILRRRLPAQRWA